MKKPPPLGCDAGLQEAEEGGLASVDGLVRKGRRRRKQNVWATIKLAQKLKGKGYIYFLRGKNYGTTSRVPVALTSERATARRPSRQAAQ